MLQTLCEQSLKSSKDIWALFHAFATRVCEAVIGRPSRSTLTSKLLPQMKRVYTTSCSTICTSMRRSFKTSQILQPASMLLRSSWTTCRLHGCVPLQTRLSPCLKSLRVFLREAMVGSRCGTLESLLRVARFCCTSYLASSTDVHALVRELVMETVFNIKQGWQHCCW